MSDLLFKYDLYSFISHRCKPPDHSLLSVNLKCSYIDKGVHNNCSNVNNMSGDNTSTNLVNKSSQKRRFNFKNKLEACINSYECRQESQESIDIVYNQYSEVVFTELDSFLKIGNISKSTKRRYRNNKPYWSDDLKIMWKEMRYAENSFLNHNKNGCKKSKIN